MDDKKLSPAVLRKQGFLLGMGLTLLIDGFIICLVNFNFINATLKQIWPLFVIIAGFCFLGADLFIYRRLRTAFLFPSIMLIFLGTAFLVFSSDVFNISFRQFISVCWPIVLVVFGILLLFVYGIQRINNKQFQFPYMQDDTLEEDNY
ncbi:hypothetical protein [Treponema sp.]|uniref:hypothetical protein n=1 Tax=Treponema sp. TaxID=166 RepID=UPI00298D7E39|nr:hypothetical protein [Treponema sp.]MCQ2240729.1 hypothetical protein [Treponema sp.]